MAQKKSRSQLKAEKKEKAARKTATPETAQKPKKEEKPKRKNTLIEYLKDVKSEMHLVTWPNTKETLSTSRFVIATLVVGGVMLWVIDSLTVVGMTSLSGLHI